jgi:hypothetical protein
VPGVLDALTAQSLFPHTHCSEAIYPPDPDLTWTLYR